MDMGGNPVRLLISVYVYVKLIIKLVLHNWDREGR